jgi:histidinol-phosphate/aromatic aminotransferase/cobyric acid decarboxylase-like protein
MKDIENPCTNSACFFCSPNNPAGLKLTFQETETEPHEFVYERMRESQVVSKRLR